MSKNYIQKIALYIILIMVINSCSKLRETINCSNIIKPMIIGKTALYNGDTLSLKMSFAPQEGAYYYWTKDDPNSSTNILVGKYNDISYQKNNVTKADAGKYHLRINTINEDCNIDIPTDIKVSNCMVNYGYCKIFNGQEFYMNYLSVNNIYYTLSGQWEDAYDFSCSKFSQFKLYCKEDVIRYASADKTFNFTDNDYLYSDELRILLNYNGKNYASNSGTVNFSLKGSTGPKPFSFCDAIFKNPANSSDIIKLSGILVIY